MLTKVFPIVGTRKLSIRLFRKNLWGHPGFSYYETIHGNHSKMGLSLVDLTDISDADNVVLGHLGSSRPDVPFKGK